MVVLSPGWIIVITERRKCWINLVLFFAGYRQFSSQIHIVKLWLLFIRAQTGDTYVGNVFVHRAASHRQCLLDLHLGWSYLKLRQFLDF